MIAREGVLPAATSLLLSGAAVGTGAPLVALAGLVLSVVVLWLFRDPPRDVPSLPLAIVSPADARLVTHGVRRDPWLDRECLRLSLKFSSLGLAVIRCPVEGQVREFWVRGGLGPDGDLATASSPTCYALWIRTDEGDDVVVAVYGRRFISRFKSDVSPGERIGHGKRLGFVYFGTAVSVYAPPNSIIEPGVAEGQPDLLGGSQVLATLARGAAADVAGIARRSAGGAQCCRGTVLPRSRP